MKNDQIHIILVCNLKIVIIKFWFSNIGLKLNYDTHCQIKFNIIHLDLKLWHLEISYALTGNLCYKMLEGDIHLAIIMPLLYHDWSIILYILYYMAVNTVHEEHQIS